MAGWWTTWTAPGITRTALIEGIIGQAAAGTTHSTRGRATARDAILEVHDLVRQPMVKGVSLRVGRGEVVGVAGLVGAGRTEVARMLFGLDQPESGRIVLEGKEVRPRSTREASRLGVALIPEERRTQGVLLDESVRFNLTLPSLRDFRVALGVPLLRFDRTAARAQELGHSARYPHAERPHDRRRLSGGNQQKVVVGKWLMRRPRLLILDEPTRGVDVGARAEIHRTIRGLAASGVAILMIASELEELLTCDRVIVLREGRVAGVLRSEDITVPAMLSLCYGAVAA